MNVLMHRNRTIQGLIAALCLVALSGCVSAEHGDWNKLSYNAALHNSAYAGPQSIYHY